MPLKVIKTAAGEDLALTPFLAGFQTYTFVFSKEGDTIQVKAESLTHIYLSDAPAKDLNINALVAPGSLLALEKALGAHGTKICPNLTMLTKPKISEPFTKEEAQEHVTKFKAAFQGFAEAAKDLSGAAEKAEAAQADLAAAHEAAVPLFSVEDPKFAKKKDVSPFQPKGQTTDLRKADMLLQPVRGTDKGSIYFTVAISEKVKVAARIKNKMLSFRVDDPHKKVKPVAEVGLLRKGEYLSCHISVADKLSAQIMGLLGLLDVQFNQIVTSVTAKQIS